MIEVREEKEANESKGKGDDATAVQKSFLQEGDSIGNPWKLEQDFSWPCAGYDQYKPAAANAKLQMGFAFTGYLLLNLFIVGAFYWMNMYRAMVYVEVKDLAKAKVIGFSEDLIEDEDHSASTADDTADSKEAGALETEPRAAEPLEDGSAHSSRSSSKKDTEPTGLGSIVRTLSSLFSGGQDVDGTGAKAEKTPLLKKKAAQKKKTPDQILRARKLQPISYIQVKQSTLRRANVQHEAMQILDPSWNETSPRSRQRSPSRSVEDNSNDVVFAEQENKPGAGRNPNEPHEELTEDENAGKTGSTTAIRGHRPSAAGIHGQTVSETVVPRARAASKEPMKSGDPESRYFNFRCMRYNYDYQAGCFVPVKNRLHGFSANDVFDRFFTLSEVAPSHSASSSSAIAVRTESVHLQSQHRIGLGRLSARQLGTLQQYFGRNTVEPDETKTYWSCFWSEVSSSFFYVFQLGLALVYCFMDAVFEGIFYECIFLSAALVASYFGYNAWLKICDMSRSNSRVKVWRQHIFEQVPFPTELRSQRMDSAVDTRDDNEDEVCGFAEISTEDLLPGDCIEISEGMVLNCECVLVQGGALMNEANLTGESTPMEKMAIEKLRESTLRAYAKEHREDGLWTGPELSLTKNKSNFLFSGTEVLSVQTRSDELQTEDSVTPFDRRGTYAIVTGIGTGTQRGDLIRGLFYPMPFTWELSEHLAAARTVFLCLWPVAAIILFALTNPFGSPAKFEAMITVLLTTFTLLAQLTQPVIESMWARSEAKYIRNCENQGLLCLEFGRLPQAGRLKVFCFDKTGTLTKEGLDFFGVSVLKIKSPLAERFSEMRASIRSTSPPILTESGEPWSHDHSSMEMKDGESTVGGEEDVTSQLIVSPTDSYENAEAADDQVLRKRIQQRNSIVNGFGSNAAVKQLLEEVLYDNADQLNTQMIDMERESLLFGIAACHSLSLDSERKTIGNPLELEAVSRIGWKVTVKPDFVEYGYADRENVRRMNTSNVIMEAGKTFDNAPQRIEILKKWKFDQERQLQAVLCNTGNVSSPDMTRATCFAKGSVESAIRLLRRGGAEPGLDAELLQQVANAYSLKGFYVIALCQCECEVAWESIEELGLDDVLETEKGPAKFEYVGMLLFKNELRRETRGMIRELEQAGIESLIITGDSVHTGVAIGEQCGIVGNCPYLIDVEEGHVMWKELSPDAIPYSGEAVPPSEPDSAIVRSSSSTSSSSYASHRSNLGKRDLSVLARILERRNQDCVRGRDFVSCAITAAAFERIRAFSSWDAQLVWYRLLPYVHIYGRVKPDGKREVIRMLQEVYAKTVIGMCGDGGNDSGALKQAHVGVALIHGRAGASGSDSNVVAPFVATEDQINKVLTLVREGRACLDTQVSLFYFFFQSGVTYGLMLKIWMQSRMAFLTGFQFMALDFTSFLLFPFLFPLQDTKDYLTRQSPSARLASWRSFGLIAVLYASHALTFLVEALVQTYATSESETPELSVQRSFAEKVEPSWYSPVSLTKDNLWFLGSIHGRSQNFDAALLFKAQLLRDVATILALACGAKLRNVDAAGPKRRVGGLAESEQRLLLPSDGNDAYASPHDDATGGGRNEADGDVADDIENAETLRARALGSHRDRTRARKRGPKFVANPDALVRQDTEDEEEPDEEEASEGATNRRPAGRTSGRASGRAASANSGNASRTNAALEGRSPSKSSARRPVSCLEKYLVHPYKKPFFLNWSFTLFLVFDVTMLLVIMFTHNTMVNYLTNLNLDSFAFSRIRTYDEFKNNFFQFHGAGRIMKPVTDLGLILENSHHKFSEGTLRKMRTLDDLSASGAPVTTDDLATGSEDTPCNLYLQKILKENNKQIENSEEKLLNAETTYSFRPQEDAKPSGFEAAGETDCGVRVTKSNALIDLERSSTLTNEEFYTQYARTGEVTVDGSGGVGFFGRWPTETKEKPGHKGMWCQYLCIDSWQYRSIRGGFGCKYTYLNREEGSCFMFQGNFDQFTVVGGGETEWSKDLHVLNRHHISGLDKEGVWWQGFNIFEVIIDFINFWIIFVVVKNMMR